MKMNYWLTKRIHWYDYTPQDIFVKSNPTTKQLEGEIQTCSYKTKQGFYETLEETQGKGCGTGVCVKLTQLKDDYPCAEIDFLKYNIDKRFASGDFRWTSPNAICYIHSHHVDRQYIKDPQQGWILQKTRKVVGDEEGYQVAFSANQSQFGGDRRECQEMMDISFAVIDFLVERILPLKQKKSLTGVA
tara:strand:+ start:30 stop:593 length:564 start_codon:yes stop_codon:yes gene_type:complete